MSLRSLDASVSCRDQVFCGLYEACLTVVLYPAHSELLGRFWSFRKLRGGVVVPSLARAAEEMVLNAIDAEASMVEAALGSKDGSTVG